MSRYEEVAVEEHDGWRVLRLAGEVDVASAPRLRDRLVQLITEGPPRLVVDLSGITFIDSMGLGALVSGLKRARALDGDLRLAGAIDHVAKVLSITRLDQAFVVGESVEAGRWPEARGDPMGEVVELEIPPTLEYLDLARVVVSAAASVDPGFPPSRVSDLRLAVSELCANAIESQQRADNAEPLIIRCDLDDDRVTIEIEDHGGGFDPDALSPMPHATDPSRLERERGLGIPLVRSLADDVEFLVKDEGTLVRVVLFHPRPG